MPKFIAGERVKRLEDREITGAVVLEVIEIETGGFIYHIQYDEAISPGNDGTGWWYEDNLIKE